jgi:hypothetical protein
MSDEFPDHGLVMPFVTVASRGGPHDDESYVAGYAMGLLDIYLKIGQVEDGIPVRGDSLPQADLLAMRYGYRMFVSPDDFSGWRWASFTRAEVEST